MGYSKLCGKIEGETCKKVVFHWFDCMSTLILLGKTEHFFCSLCTELLSEKINHYCNSVGSLCIQIHFLF